MFANVPSATLVGVDGLTVRVEVHVASGLPQFSIVGLPDASCREARDRVRAAIASSGLRWPARRVTVNLAPSGLRKVGSGLDLAIAVATLVADGQLPAASVSGLAFVGELGLDGSVRRVEGTLPLVGALPASTVVVGRDAAAEAALVGGERVVAAASLRQVAATLRGEDGWSPIPDLPAALCPPPTSDLADVRGQRLGRLAVEVAAAGGHHLLLVGPPGAGKTMLAQRLADLLPPLERDECLEVTRIHSAAGVALPSGVLVRRPPLRSPHHSSSMVSLIGGGGQHMRPGEISCAHRGVLFLDELGEFSSEVLDCLRQPLEDGTVLVCRARATATFPANFLLVAATNPCPCGGDGSPGGCRCSNAARARYAARISGPLMDRFDLRLVVERPEVDELLPPVGCTPGPIRGGCAEGGVLGVPTPAAAAAGSERRAGRRVARAESDGHDRGSQRGRDRSDSLGAEGGGFTGESTATVAARVVAARRRAGARGVRANADIPAAALDALAPLTPAARHVLEVRLRQGRLSARGLHRVRRVAATLADLADLAELADADLADLAGPVGPVGEEAVHTALALRADPFPVAPVEW